MALLTRARDNEKVKNDVSLFKSDREKIKLIEEYKAYFYHKFNLKPKNIYSKTTILKNPAVTYLVINSSHREIKALDHCFIVVGCFPYLGFFKMDDALKFKAQAERDGLSSYLRPVYAYSTLGYFEDTILSSFFYYDEIELAELIFHELFHTIFFIENEVELNENLANYFSKELLKQYFTENQHNPELKMKYLEFNNKLKSDKEFKRVILLAISELNAIYTDNENKNKVILTQYLAQSFRPKLLALCRKFEMKTCHLANSNWNNARFAAFGTYEKREDQIEMLARRLQSEMIPFYSYIIKQYDKFKQESKKQSFADFLLLGDPS